MAFHDIQFPADISYGSSGGPHYSTDIVITQGGHEQRNINWQAACARYNVAHGVKTQEQLDHLIAFFRARKGRAHSFRFKDWTDYEVVAEVLGTADGTITAFQMTKSYISGSQNDIRTLTKLVSGSVNIYLDDILQQSGYMVDESTGIVTFDVAPGNGVVIKADCQFDVPVRFDTDQLSATLENYGVRSWLDIPLIEVRG